MASNGAGTYGLGSGFTLALFFVSVDYLITAIMIHVGPPEKIHHSIHAPIKWLGRNSAITTFALVYNYFFGHKIIHSILALLMLLGSTIGVVVYFIYTTFSANRTAIRDSLNFLLSITYLWLNIIACTNTTANLIQLMNQRVKEAQKSAIEAPKMSEVMAPSGLPSAATRAQD